MKMSNWFNIENDGITVNKERVEKWSYIKYPPHSKYLLVSNLLYVTLLLILVALTAVIMFSAFDVIEWYHYMMETITMLVPVAVLYTTIKEWKYGKNFTDEN